MEAAEYQLYGASHGAVEPGYEASKYWFYTDFYRVEAFKLLFERGVLRGFFQFFRCPSQGCGSVWPLCGAACFVGLKANCPGLSGQVQPAQRWWHKNMEGTAAVGIGA